MRIARASELGSCQSNVCLSWGYKRLQKSKDSLNTWSENVNIEQWTNKKQGEPEKADFLDHNTMCVPNFKVSAVVVPDGNDN